MLNRLKKILTHPLMRDVDLDSPETASRVFTIINEKKNLKQIYENWYSFILQALPADRNGSILELGSGSGFLEKYIPNLITSEILNIQGVRVVLDGQSLPFQKNSLSGIVMVDVLHHLPDVKTFFREAATCVSRGGVIVMIEPWVTWWSSIVYGHLHHEPFDAKSNEWTFAKGAPLTQANSALPWIVFQRDREVFTREFAEWRILDIQLHTPFIYLLSGGVTLRNFVPGFLFDFCKRFEAFLNPWIGTWAMFATIVLKRN